MPRRATAIARLRCRERSSLTITVQDRPSGEAHLARIALAALFWCWTSRVCHHAGPPGPVRSRPSLTSSAAGMSRELHRRRTAANGNDRLWGNPCARSGTFWGFGGFYLAAIDSGLQAAVGCGVDIASRKGSWLDGAKTM